jgi:cyclic pyranopterin monophosphate synthase
MSDLSHVDETGRVRMVDVGGKEVSRRRAVAQASLRMAPATARRLRELPKGDALAAAQLAGIMAAKRTSELIPLCHPLPLTHVDVALSVAEASVEITASAETTAQTGVEMEALVGAKAVDDGMELSEVRLVEKTKEPAE